jgi:2-polyprenyl-3-methyl-5-hydroxy-6-metoxy-1,4-benzoquinol methylase
MINSSRIMEGFLQQSRFKKVLPFLKGDVLDFGGNEGELKKYVNGSYTLVNYDHSPMENKTFDTVVALAVIEHIEVNEVFRIFKTFQSKVKPKGIIFLTTPTPLAKPLLELMASVNLLDRHNIEEHKHYWTKKELQELAEKNGFTVKKYKKFQLGFNQLAILEQKANQN